jgi:uncharacterized membrane protein YiaA
METSHVSPKRRFGAVIVLARRAADTFQRFPLALIAAIGAAVVLHRLADISFNEGLGAQALYPILMTCVLAVPLFIALPVTAESRNWPRRARLGATAVAVLALALYYWSLPYPVKGADLVHFFLLLAALHLLVSFAPFAGRRREENGFWQYNKALFLRFATAALYSTVLYIGLALAIGACETLLDFDFDSEIYLQLWYWAVAVYNTWFFLAGIPRDIRGLQQNSDYPTALRVFSQYVLIPLVAVYLAILYAYLAKIVIEWDLPKGWVGYPVMGVAITGMLAYLLVYPMRDRRENAWISTYARYFTWSLFPLIGLMAVAIGTRISDYGITERRYLAAVATVWLFGSALYSAIRRERADIRAIPTSLCIVALLSAFGPWGATSVSRSQQLGRLRDLLVREDAMVGGVLSGDARSIDFEQQKEISNIVKYLHDYHGLATIRSWYASSDIPAEDLTPSLAMQEMGLEYLGPRVRSGQSFSLSANLPNPLSVAGFDYAYRADYFWDDEAAIFSVDLDSLSVLSLNGTTVRLGEPSRPISFLEVDLRPKIADLRKNSGRGETIRPADATIEAENDSYRLTIYLNTIAGAGSPDSSRLSQLNATFLVDRR